MTEDVARLRLSVESSGVDKAQRKLKDLAKTGGNAEEGLNKASKGGRRLTGSMIALVGGVGGLTLAVKSTLKSWFAFDKAMVEVSTIAGVTNKRMTELRRSALLLSQSLGLDATEAAQGFYQALSAGVDESEVVEFMQNVGKFGQAAMTDTATATDLLTTALNSYNLDASQAAEVSDRLFTTIKLGKTNGEQLARSFARASGAASAGDVSMQELLGTVAQLTKKGVPTAEAFTQIKAAIQALYNPSSELVDIYDKLGVSGGRQLIKQEGLAGALDKVRTATNGNDAVLIKALRSSEAYNGALFLTAENLEDVRDLTAQVANGTGAVDEAAAKVGELLENKITALKTSFLILNEDIEKTYGIIEGAGVVIDALTKKLKELQKQQEQTGGDPKKKDFSVLFIEALTSNLYAEAMQNAMRGQATMEEGIKKFERIAIATNKAKKQLDDISGFALDYYDVQKRINALDEGDILYSAKLTALKLELDSKRNILRLGGDLKTAEVKRLVALVKVNEELESGVKTVEEYEAEVLKIEGAYKKAKAIIERVNKATAGGVSLEQEKKKLVDLKIKASKLYLAEEDKVLRKLKEEEKVFLDILETQTFLNKGEKEQLALIRERIQARKEENKEAAKTPELKAFERLAESTRTPQERASDERKEGLDIISASGASDEDKAEQTRRVEGRYQQDLESLSDIGGSSSNKATDLQGDINTEAKSLSLEFGSDDPYQGEIERLKAFEAEKLEIVSEATNLTESKRAEIKLNIQNDTDRKIKAVEEAQFQERLALASDFFGNLSTVAKAFGEKGAKAAKAFAIVQATIDTYASAVAAYKAVVGIPYVGPALAPVAAAGAIAAGLAQVAAIKAQKYQQGGIVGGASYGGDQINAKLNSGEMVLNKQQQSNLFAQANNPIGGSRGGNVTIINNTRSEFDAETKTNNEGDMQIIVKEAVEKAKIELTNEAQEGGGSFLPALENSYGLIRK